VRSHFKSNAKKFLAVFEEILNKDRSEISDIINKALEEVGDIAGEDLFKEYYNFQKLNNAGLYNDDNMLVREKLSGYLTDVINSNFDKLQVMHTCLQVEMAYKKKDKETLDKLFDKIDDNNYECISPLSLKSFDLQDLFIAQEL
jgi:hypothetical protein